MTHDMPRLIATLAAADEAGVSDDANPRFILQVVRTDLLVKAANGELDLNALAAFELAMRGLTTDGKPARAGRA